MNTYPHYIACAQLTTRTIEDNARCMRAATALAGAMNVPYVVVAGAYNGAPETSLDLYGPHAERCARAIAIAFDQETYLEITSYDHAALIAQDGTTVCNFTQRIEGSADNYTVDSLGNRYTFI